MTLVVGFNMDPYALIGSDTGVCYFPPSGEVIYRDDREKLQPTLMGLISGAGLTNLLDPVKEPLDADEIANTDQIRDVVRAERRVVTSAGQALNLACVTKSPAPRGCSLTSTATAQRRRSTISRCGWR